VLAFQDISGIITTNPDETATLVRVAGRERRVHHSKSLPLLLTGERFFFARNGLASFQEFLCNSLNNRILMLGGPDPAKTAARWQAAEYSMIPK
jgi:hypothetical protein